MPFRLLSLVPGDDWREADLVHAREEGERSEDERGPDELVLVEEGNELEWLVQCQLQAPSFVSLRYVSYLLLGLLLDLSLADDGCCCLSSYIPPPQLLRLRISACCARCRHGYVYGELCPQPTCVKMGCSRSREDSWLLQAQRESEGWSCYLAESNQAVSQACATAT